MITAKTKMSSNNTSFEIEPREGCWYDSEGRCNSINKIAFGILENGQTQPGTKIKSWWRQALASSVVFALPADTKLDAIKQENRMSQSELTLPAKFDGNPGEVRTSSVEAGILEAHLRCDENQAHSFVKPQVSRDAQGVREEAEGQVPSGKTA